MVVSFYYYRQMELLYESNRLMLMLLLIFLDENKIEFAFDHGKKHLCNDKISISDQNEKIIERFMAKQLKCRACVFHLTPKE